MKKVKVNLSNVKMDGVFVCSEDEGYKEVDLSKVGDLNGEDVAMISFTMDNDRVVCAYVNTDISCFSELKGEKKLDKMIDMTNENTHYFSLHNNNSFYPIDHFDVVGLLADKGIDYDYQNGNLELTFEREEENFKSEINNYGYDFSVVYS